MPKANHDLVIRMYLVTKLAAELKDNKTTSHEELIKDSGCHQGEVDLAKMLYKKLSLLKPSLSSKSVILKRDIKHVKKDETTEDAQKRLQDQLSQLGAQRKADSETKEKRIEDAHVRLRNPKPDAAHVVKLKKTPQPQPDAEEAKTGKTTGEAQKRLQDQLAQLRLKSKGHAKSKEERLDHVQVKNLKPDATQVVKPKESPQKQPDAKKAKTGETTKVAQIRLQDQKLRADLISSNSKLETPEHYTNLGLAIALDNYKLVMQCVEKEPKFSLTDTIVNETSKQTAFEFAVDHGSYMALTALSDHLVKDSKGDKDPVNEELEKRSKGDESKPELQILISAYKSQKDARGFMSTEKDEKPKESKSTQSKILETLFGKSSLSSFKAGMKKEVKKSAVKKDSKAREVESTVMPTSTKLKLGKWSFFKSADTTPLAHAKPRGIKTSEDSSKQNQQSF